MTSLLETIFIFSTARLNTSGIDKTEPLTCGSPGKPCEWPLLWTLFAAFFSSLVFCFVQVVLYFVNDPGKAESKKVEFYINWMTHTCTHKNIGCIVQFSFSSRHSAIGNSCSLGVDENMLSNCTVSLI